MKRPPGIERHIGETINVLSVSPDEADHDALQNIFQVTTSKLDANGNSRWMLRPIRTLALTAEPLTEQEVPIVISESELSPGTWHDILDYISSLPDPPLLIVTSKLADMHLWAEALNLGAWDVLQKPFDPNEVVHALHSAWRHWQERHGIHKKRTKQRIARSPKLRCDRMT